ncbi:MAG: phosphoribosylformylglycinamidine cyclo-ligase [Elusimicrobia bacterium]|nr:phosphoribosylformylglycinamidine cyclo-ligase [Elusimicrobiota bacterium]
MKSWTYKKSGVDIDAGDALVDHIRKRIPSIGDFAGLFPLPKNGRGQSYLVGCTDGVGTKLKVAQELGLHDTIGIDLVAMNVNDLLCCGAKPLFFLDYYAAGKLDLKVAKRVVDGIIRGCREADCLLIGGETAEMPGMYPAGEYDLAGFAVGLVNEAERVRNERIKPGDVLLGLPSSGVHSNGYSLARALFKGKDLKKWGKKLIEPTRIYVRPVRKALAAHPGAIKGLAHITGGGLLENVPRFLPKKTDAVLYKASWPVPEVFTEMQRRGRVDENEMFRTFNMGLGMVLAVSREKAQAVKKLLEPCYEVGRIQTGSRIVRFV